MPQEKRGRKPQSSLVMDFSSIFPTDEKLTKLNNYILILKGVYKFNNSGLYPEFDRIILITD